MGPQPEQVLPADHLEESAIRLDLDVGSYEITLEPGWVLERLGESEPQAATTARIAKNARIGAV